MKVERRKKQSILKRERDSTSGSEGREGLVGGKEWRENAWVISSVQPLHHTDYVKYTHSHQFHGYSYGL